MVTYVLQKDFSNKMPGSLRSEGSVGVSLRRGLEGGT